VRERTVGQPDDDEEEAEQTKKVKTADQ